MADVNFVLVLLLVFMLFGCTPGLNDISVKGIAKLYVFAYVPEDSSADPDAMIERVSDKNPFEPLSRILLSENRME